MLIDLEYNPEDYLFPHDNPMFDSISNDIKDIKLKHTIERIQKGVYNYWDTNAIMLPGYNCIHAYDRDTMKILPYGVCDNVSQIFERDKRIQKYIDDPDNEYVIAICIIKKSDQPAHGGWRWHKWGSYIGNYEITTEYLYDENIDHVYVYAVNKVNKETT